MNDEAPILKAVADAMEKATQSERELFQPLPKWLRLLVLLPGIVFMVYQLMQIGK